MYERVNPAPTFFITPGEPELYVAKSPVGLFEVAEDPWSVAQRCELTARLDEEALIDVLARPLHPADYTRSLLAGVQRVPIWASATIDRGRLSIRDAVLPSEEISESVTDSVDRLESTLCQIISESIKGKQHPAILCSGGLDSSVIAALTARVLGHAPTLMTITGGLLSAAEIPLIKAVVDSLGARWINLDQQFSFELEDLYAQNSGSSWPAGGVFSTVWRTAADSASNHQIDVLLTGEGANEICSPDGAESLDLFKKHKWVDSAQALGRARDTFRTTALQYLKYSWSNRFLPTRPFKGDSKPPESWYGTWFAEFEASRQRWASRMDELHAAGFSWCEALARSRIDRILFYAPSDPLGRIEFRHPISDPRFRAAYFSSPIEHRTGVRIGVGTKQLLRFIARRYLPAAVAEQRKIGTGNQVGILTSSPRSNFTAFDQSAAEWLKLRLGPEFLRPWTLPSSAGLDWTQLHALLAWAANRN